jgi:hypothetical protein
MRAVELVSGVGRSGQTSAVCGSQTSVQLVRCEGERWRWLVVWVEAVRQALCVAARPACNWCGAKGSDGVG